METNKFTSEELAILQDPTFQQAIYDARPFIHDNRLDIDALHKAHPGEYVMHEVGGGKAMMQCVRQHLFHTFQPVTMEELIEGRQQIIDTLNNPQQ